jgi:hypothetical protein
MPVRLALPQREPLLDLLLYTHPQRPPIVITVVLVRYLKVVAPEGFDNEWIVMFYHALSILKHAVESSALTSQGGCPLPDARPAPPDILLYRWRCEEL